MKLGDEVRISKNKTIFEKGYTPNWSTEIFTINKVSTTSFTYHLKDTPNWSTEIFTINKVSTTPFTYHLKDDQDKPIAGGFYEEEELMKTKYPDIYLQGESIPSGKRIFAGIGESISGT